MDIKKFGRTLFAGMAIVCSAYAQNLDVIVKPFFGRMSEEEKADADRIKRNTLYLIAKGKDENEKPWVLRSNALMFGGYVISAGHCVSTSTAQRKGYTGKNRIFRGEVSIVNGSQTSDKLEEVFSDRLTDVYIGKLPAGKRGDLQLYSGTSKLLRKDKPVFWVGSEGLSFFDDKLLYFYKSRLTSNTPATLKDDASKCEIKGLRWQMEDANFPGNSGGGAFTKVKKGKENLLVYLGIITNNVPNKTGRYQGQFVPADWPIEIIKEWEREKGERNIEIHPLPRHGY